MGEQMEGQSQDDIVKAVYAYAAEEMRNDVPNDKIKASLVERGLSEDVAASVVSDLAKAKSDLIRETGNKNMLYGALWAIGGTVVTMATYSAAKGGGTYIVAWGAILFGIVQFFQGLSQASKA